MIVKLLYIYIFLDIYISKNYSFTDVQTFNPFASESFILDEKNTISF